MKRTYHTFPVNKNTQIKQQMLDWANRFNICCFLNNHHYSSAHHSFECLVGAGAVQTFRASAQFFPSLSAFIRSQNDWLFGHFNYDIKNRIEKDISSGNPDFTGFPEYCLFVPEVVLQLIDNNLVIGVIKGSPGLIYNEIVNEKAHTNTSASLQIKPRVSRQQYIQTVSKLLGHIHKGDCYEINFCQEFFANGLLDPLSVYRQLNEISPNPFSAYYRVNDKYLMCSSPERYIRREGNRVISQPIKGTVARKADDQNLDETYKKQLHESGKDRSENVMIVDLVRNDLSKICREGSVVVDELFGIHTFPNLHHMISTISGVVDAGIDFAEVLKATFPMGSMTGAPKKKVMELIEKYEVSRRGIYSGTVGYIAPNHDFDFNVVIRSLVYDAASTSLSFHVGSAITANSDPEKEYEECLLKGQALMKIFTDTDQPF